MIRKYRGYEAKISRGFEELPTGCHVCTIMNAEVKSYDWGEKLFLSLDVADGENRGYYAKQYREDTREDKRWGCVLGLYIPADDGSEKDDWTKKTFNNFTGCMEEANAGYRYDSDEAKMKGKKIAVLFRREEWEYNGKTGWKVKPFKVVSIEDFKAGKEWKCDDKPLANKPSAPSSFSFESVMASESDLPF